eukprot:8398782-Heterocapsa_arctica.AAC.1
MSKWEDRKEEQWTKDWKSSKWQPVKGAAGVDTTAERKEEAPQKEGQEAQGVKEGQPKEGKPKAANKGCHPQGNPPAGSKDPGPHRH